MHLWNQFAWVNQRTSQLTGLPCVFKPVEKVGPCNPTGHESPIAWASNSRKWTLNARALLFKDRELLCPMLWEANAGLREMMCMDADEVRAKWYQDHPNGNACPYEHVLFE